MRLVTCEADGDDCINFVARTERNNGVVAIVRKLTRVTPIPPGTISVAASGSVLSAFLQTKKYYSGRDLYYLSSRNTMSERELIYYSMCIRKNKYRYCYGRQANRTLRDLLVPACMPKRFATLTIRSPSTKPAIDKKVQLNERAWQWFRYDDLLEIEIGKGPLVQSEEHETSGKTPYISTTTSDNGICYFCDEVPTHPAGRITISNDGSVGEAFYQDQPFVASYKVNVLLPRFKCNASIAMFLITLMRREKYRYSYARKWGLERMRISRIKLPVNGSGKPDWKFMEHFVKSLPYSGAIRKKRGGADGGDQRSMNAIEVQ
jgi:hypothetical protein